MKKWEIHQTDHNADDELGEGSIHIYQLVK